MNLELFIARRIRFKRGVGKKTAPAAIRIAVAGVALGLTVMILSVAIVVGFKHQIRAKVIGFGSHIQITSFDENSSYETKPIGLTDSLLRLLHEQPDIERIDCFATKPAMIRTDSAFQGVVVKGVATGYDWRFFSGSLEEGRLPIVTDTLPSNEVLISRDIANKMRLRAGDPLYTYFVQDERVRVRKFAIVGIYRTDFADYDQLFLVGDARQIQRLNDWAPDQYSGIEIRLREEAPLDEIAESLYFACIDLSDAYGETYYVRSVREMNAQLFSWLDLLDLNVWVILTLMALVSGFTMISGLLIIILERTNMIGILKALGARDGSIRKTFLYLSLFLVGKGMLWGNLIGISLCLIQRYTGILVLDPETYYLAAVPIELHPLHLLLINVGCFTVSLLMLIGPSYLIARLSPARSIRFE